MMKTQNNSRGFSTVEVLLIVLVLVLLCSAGWYVYSKNQDKTNDGEISNPKSSTSSKVSDDKNNLDKTKGWFIYEAPDKKYSIKLPDGWKLKVADGGSSPYAISAQDISSTAGAAATVIASDYAGDISHVAFAMSDAPEGFFGQEPRGTKQLTFLTKGGLEVSRYDFTVEDEPEDLPQGMIRYDYRISKDGKNFQVVHDVLKGEAAQTSLVEEAIKTLELK